MPYDPISLPPEGIDLLRAAQIVRERWRQNEYGEDGGPRCAIGAISEVTGILCDYLHSGWQYHPVTSLLRPFVGEKDIPYWNDDPARTAEEVATAMEAAAYATVEG